MKKFKLYASVLLLLITVMPIDLAKCQSHDKFQKFHLLKIKTPEDLHKLLSFDGKALPIICGHRGGAFTDYPENCIQTYENTLKNAYSIIECDPRYTKDGSIVLHHDPTLQRTTNGQGRVMDYTLKELKELKLKDLKGTITEYQIPTLDETLEWVKGKAILLLDQKDVTAMERLKKVEEHKAISNVIFTIYNFGDAELCYNHNNKIMMQVFIPSMEKALEFEKSGVPWKNVIASVGHKIPLDSALYKYIHQKGALCTAASMETIDRAFLTGQVSDFSQLKEDYVSFLSTGVDLIQTDLPAKVGPMIYGINPNAKSGKYFKYRRK